MAFQKDAFQHDAFQPGVPESKDAFQGDGFQGDAFQIGAPGTSAGIPGCFFGGQFFGGGFFCPESTPVDHAGGKGDNDRRIVKPTGILHLPKKARKDVSDRIEESQALHAEIAARLAGEFEDESAAISVLRQKNIEEMHAAEIELEIKLLLRQRMRSDEAELLLLLLMAAAIA